MRTITDDYGAEFAAHSDILAYRTIGIYVFLRTVMCSPVRASQIAHALKLPRVSVVRRAPANLLQAGCGFVKLDSNDRRKS
jgi:hypothetical protein